MYEGSPGLREAEGGVEGEIGVSEEGDSGGEGDDEGEHEVQNEKMGAGDEGLAEGECDQTGGEQEPTVAPPSSQQTATESFLHSQMPTQTSSSFVPPPNDAENVQTSCVSNQVPTQRQQNMPAYRPPRPQNVPAYRPPRPQTVPQPSAQNVNQQPSQASTCFQTKAAPKPSRKQKVPVSLSSKLEKTKVPESSSQDAFKRQCCPPKKSSISSVLKGVADSYRPRTQASGSSSTIHSPGN
ncbi:hypothetical protein Salat_2548500 [Sesamum alatum]|uniref:Uncharacterized protein n=1 Tax=Sesamum alatum TaxID=300844 RepID=A0AAE2CCL6_9LAMI|nr:hypothetical protein Salat_2548500 [Sesamum alatum]